GSGLGLAPVAAEEVRAPEPDLADLPGRDVAPVLADDADLQDRDRAPRAARLAHVVVARALRAVAVGLGHAVADVRPPAGEAPGDALHQVRGRGRAAAAHVLEARGVAAREVGRLEQVPDHRRDADEVRDALALDQLQGPLRAPAVHHHQPESPGD